MSWSDQIWALSGEAFGSILGLPFVRELSEGTLALEKFERYLCQDEIYLGNYSRQLYEFASLIEDPSQKSFFEVFARAGMESEKQMHALLGSRFGFDVTGNCKASAITLAYNSHTLRAIRSGSKELGLASLIPCMWIYNKVGLHILQSARLEDNPYREWIEEYGDPEYTRGVGEVLHMADSWAERADQSIRQAMTDLYLEGLRLEYAFWDYGYRGEEGDYSYLNI
ncbi:MAG: TenA family protein [Bacteroidales bacterium]|nr:TenA family protein [Bacteroidales bacterium]